MSSAKRSAFVASGRLWKRRGAAGGRGMEVVDVVAVDDDPAEVVAGNDATDPKANFANIFAITGRRPLRRGREEYFLINKLTRSSR